MKTIITSLFFLLPWFTYCHAQESEYSKFYGHYTGKVEVSDNQQRLLDVNITPTKKGFNVTWETIKLDQAGKNKSKVYSIDFTRSNREGIYGSAMKTNLFGGQEPLDPMKGEPYFWSRIKNDTLTVYSMLITESGNYEIQRYDRSIVGTNLKLDYTLFKEDKPQKHIDALLTRQ